ncbi:hypothetical protein Bca4012_043501 [Brassica carinata]
MFGGDGVSWHKKLMKVILEKIYALAHLAIDAIVAHFIRFRKETEVLPVIWHQTIVAFVQRYKHELRKGK